MIRFLSRYIGIMKRFYHISSIFQIVFRVFIYSSFVESDENCGNTQIDIHEVYQSELIDVCSKYSNGAWLLVRVTWLEIVFIS